MDCTYEGAAIGHRGAPCRNEATRVVQWTSDVRPGFRMTVERHYCMKHAVRVETWLARNGIPYTTKEER
jgi:hypothetical protein